ncbi:hypothetical protein AKAW_06332 [Aspergillus luchuensis IFO 4308]|nr:hypothetical protein AKAW_06332 [Aspergillus luchuensis IFO 4308]
MPGNLLGHKSKGYFDVGNLQHEPIELHLQALKLQKLSQDAKAAGSCARRRTLACKPRYKFLRPHPLVRSAPIGGTSLQIFIRSYLRQSIDKHSSLGDARGHSMYPDKIATVLFRYGSGQSGDLCLLTNGFIYFGNSVVHAGETVLAAFRSAFVERTAMRLHQL